VSRYQKGKTNLDFTEARDGEWQWHQLGHMQVCTSLQTDNHSSTPPLSFLQAGYPSCRPTNSAKALKDTDGSVHRCSIVINAYLFYVSFAGLGLVTAGLTTTLTKTPLTNSNNAHASWMSISLHYRFP